MADVFVKRKRAQSEHDFESWSMNGLCPTLNVMDNTAEAYATVLIGESAGLRRLTPIECERLQGFPDGWTSQHADSVRYRQCGNAVAVPVVEWIVRRMVQQ